jgi:cysteine desulfurase / selenocysteine lyase
MLDVRADFPSLNQRPHGQRLAFLDSAASALKPTVVLESLQGALAGPYANIHRGLYHNSATTTAAYEAARAQIAGFMGAQTDEIIFTRNTTEAINVVAQTWGRANLKAGDVVLLSALEHHANIVPWQMLATQVGCEIKVLPLRGHTVEVADAEVFFAGGKVKLLAITGQSNVLGVKPPLAELTALARSHGAAVLVDASQLVVHAPLDVQALNADFVVWTGHKLYGPTGVGVLWGRAEVLADMPPYQGGGDMIETVSWNGSTFAPPPARFEAGTPAIPEGIALGVACAYVQGLGWANIQAHEAALAAALDDVLQAPFIQNYSPPGTGIAAFNIVWAHPADVATLLDQAGVAVRSGHHCAMPLLADLGLAERGCVRASVGVYSSPDDVAQLEAALHKAHRMLG